MSNFDFKKTIRRDITLREQENLEDSPIFGLNSTENDESLLRMLEKSTLSSEQQAELIDLMQQLADEHSVVLEQNLTGLRSEKDRIIPAKAILDLMDSMRLNGGQKKNLAKILDQWGKFNSVRFDMRAGDKRPKDPTSLNQVDRDASMDTVGDLGDPDDTPTEEVPKKTKQDGPFKVGQMMPSGDDIKIVPAGQENISDYEISLRKSLKKLVDDDAWKNASQNRKDITDPLWKAMQDISKLNLAERKYIHLLKRFKINENNK
tara:strand:+ start:15574 stop:16359 length:786 start_codon:yes stop_codon:yes gene_type:complete